MPFIPTSKTGKLAGILLLIFAIIQLVPPSPVNTSSIQSDAAIQKHYPVPDPVLDILRKACYDCHSNNTAYPWYSRIQPFRMLLDKHIKDGKKGLNFDEFTKYSLKRQHHKFESIQRQVEQNEMPLQSYKWLHPEARLKDSENKMLIEWAKDGEQLFQ